MMLKTVCTSMCVFLCVCVRACVRCVHVPIPTHAYLWASIFCHMQKQPERRPDIIRIELTQDFVVSSTYVHHHRLAVSEGDLRTDLLRGHRGRQVTEQWISL